MRAKKEGRKDRSDVRVKKKERKIITKPTGKRGKERRKKSKETRAGKEGRKERYD